MLTLMKNCPNCSRIVHEYIFTNSIRNLTCTNCGYFEVLTENNKSLDVEKDQGRYICIYSGKPFGAATIYYKSGQKYPIAISLNNSDSFIDNLIRNKDIISAVSLSYFKNNEFHEIDLLEYL